MRKILFLCIVLVICLTMFTSCLFDKREKDTFFSDEVLASNKLEGMPQPNLESSYLVEGDTLYLNLTDEEYAAYVEELAKFLVAKEDIYTPAYAYGFGNEVIFFLTFYEYAPLEYLTEYDDTEHIFIFSTDGEVAPEYRYSEYELIGIDRLSQPERLKYTMFTYNTVICLNYSTGISGARFVPCDYDRHYPENIGEYIIAGTNVYCGLQKCKYCEYTATELYREDSRFNDISYLNNSAYLKVKPSSSRDGMLCEIQAYKIEGVDIKLYANGIELPMTAEYDDYLEYKFVMPDFNIEIDVQVTSKDGANPIITKFTEAYEWLVELDAESVASLTVISEPFGAENGTIKTHHTTTNVNVISYEINRYRRAELVLTDVPTPVDAKKGTMTTAVIELYDGTKYEFAVDGNIFTYNGREYLTTEVPYIGTFTTTVHTFSFVASEKGTVYDNYTDEAIGTADISTLEFVKYLGGLDEAVPQYRIETDFGTIYIHANDIFTLEKDGVTSTYKLTKGSLLDLISK